MAGLTTAWKYRGLIWKYRRQIWKYRGLWRHRNEIRAAAGIAAGLAGACLIRRATRARLGQ